MRKKRLKLQDFLSVDSDHIYIRVFNYTALGDCQGLEQCQTYTKTFLYQKESKNLNPKVKSENKNFFDSN